MSRCRKPTSYVENFAPDYMDSPEHNVAVSTPCVRVRSHNGPCSAFTIIAINPPQITSIDDPPMLFPKFTCPASVPRPGKPPRPCRNVVPKPGAFCWRHAEAPRPVRAVTEVYDALRNGADEDVWPVGMSAGDAVTRLVEERAALRMQVARLIALLT